MTNILDRLRDAVSVALEDEVVIAGGHDAALDAAMRAGASAALAHVKEQMRSTMKPFQAYVQAECILDRALAHLTEQEQIDGEKAKEQARVSDQRPRGHGGAVGMPHSGSDRPVGDAAAPSSHTGQGSGEAKAAPQAQAVSEVETLLKEAARFDSRTGPWISAAQSLVWRLANALRASETAKQQDAEILRLTEHALTLERQESARLRVSLAQREAEIGYLHGFLAQLRRERNAAIDGEYTPTEIARRVEQAFTAGYEARHSGSLQPPAALAAYLKAQTGSETP